MTYCILHLAARRLRIWVTETYRPQFHVWMENSHGVANSVVSHDGRNSRFDPTRPCTELMTPDEKRFTFARPVSRLKTA